MPLTHVTVEEAEVLLGQINANANNLDLPNGTSVGTGLYTFSSMGNHSDQCAPARFGLCWAVSGWATALYCWGGHLENM